MTTLIVIAAPQARLIQLKVCLNQYFKLIFSFLSDDIIFVDIPGSPAKKSSSIFPGPSNASSSTPGSTPGSAGGSVSPSPDHRSKQQQTQGDQGNLQILNTKEIPFDQVWLLIICFI